MTGFEGALRGGVLAELGYRTSVGPAATTVTPHTLDGEPVLALTYARSSLAAALERSGEAVLVCSDARLCLRGWECLAVRGRVRVQPDPDGSVFRSSLLEDELRKYPPARLLADSLMERREHWWYLPRLLVRLTEPEPAGDPAPRDDPLRATCFVEGPRGLEAHTAEVRDPSGADPRDAQPGATLEVRSLAGRDSGAAGRAALLWHDFSVPDLEQRAELVLGGRLDGGRLVVDDRSGDARLPGPPGVWRRLANHKRFERACRRELRAAGRA